jgi:hypothetical protein
MMKNGFNFSFQFRIHLMVGFGLNICFAHRRVLFSSMLSALGFKFCEFDSQFFSKSAISCTSSSCSTVNEIPLLLLLLFFRYGARKIHTHPVNGN